MSDDFYVFTISLYYQSRGITKFRSRSFLRVFMNKLFTNIFYTREKKKVGEMKIPKWYIFVFILPNFS